MKESELLKIISTGDPPKLLDMSDQKIRGRVKEQLSRLMTTAKMHHDLAAAAPLERALEKAKEEGRGTKTLEKDLKIAKDRENVVRATYAFSIFHIAGSLHEEAADLREISTGKGYVIRHNDPMREATAGIMDGSWTPKTAHYTTTWQDPNGAKKLSYGKTRTQGDGENAGAITRTEVEANAALMKAHDIPYEAKEENSSTLLKYIKGQQKLLEELEQEYSL